MRLERNVAAATAGAIVLVSVVLSLSYWPGVMTWDSIRQYDQALSGRFDDWHPPLMEWIWRQFSRLYRGPGFMLLLQLGLAALGYGLLSGWALRQRRTLLAIALAAVSLTPLYAALMGTILKDSLMAALLLLAAGLLAWRRERGGVLLQLFVATLIVLACALRFNAFLAGGPLLAALLPERLRRNPAAWTVSLVAATACLMPVTPLVNQVLRAERSGVELSLVIFDLGGITDRSGHSAFPPLAVKDPVAANARCYSPVRWDKYADWAEAPCAVGFEPVRAALRRTGQTPALFWVRAIVSHPIAYAEHRLRHFNINARFLVRGQVDRPVRDHSEENDWDLHVTPNPVLSNVDRAARWYAVTPLGWPIFWMAAALGLLLIARKLPSSRLIMPLALSSLLYGLGYGLVSVSSELRYHLWTMLAAMVATCIAAADLPAARARLTRVDVLAAAAPAALVLVLGTAWRLWPA